MRELKLVVQCPEETVRAVLVGMRSLEVSGCGWEMQCVRRDMDMRRAVFASVELITLFDNYIFGIVSVEYICFDKQS